MTTRSQIVTTPDDLNELKKAVNNIIGEVSWRIKIGHATELFFHIGAPVAFLLPPSPRMKEKVGSWRLETRGTDWRIETGKGVSATSNDSEEDMEQHFHEVLDTPILEFEIIYPSLALTVAFANGAKFLILPKAEDDELDIPYWVLTTPQHAVIEVGPQKQWSISIKDQT